MSKEILNEIKELRTVLAKIIGTSDKPTREQFSITAIDKAAEEFRKMSIERGEWISEHDIDKCIKDAPYRAGAFIREHFKFTNYFKRGKSHFYNKKDLVNLSRELKERNVDLCRYMEYLEDEIKFKKYVESAKGNNRGKKIPPYEIPSDLRDITTSPAKPPATDIIKDDIKRLKREYHLNGYLDYVDIYREKHAMMKYIYYFDKYLEPGIKSRCAKWCKDFNYANDALLKVKEQLKDKSGTSLVSR